MRTARTLSVQALFVVGLTFAGLHAQSVGIGTATPHPSARLHISDNARGLLIPNVALTATNVAAPVTSPATSLLVYNTNTAGTGATAVTPGFYYWDGSQWVRLADGGKAWLLNGNAGTNPAVNFLGTTDAQPLVIRTNNTERMRVTETGFVGIGTTTPAEKVTIEPYYSFSTATITPSTIIPFGTSKIALSSDRGIYLIDNTDFIGLALKNEGNDRKDGVIYWGDNLGADNLRFMFAEWNGSFITLRDRVIITSYGNVGIGTLSPAYRLHVLGDVYATGEVYCYGWGICIGSEMEDEYKTHSKCS